MSSLMEVVEEQPGTLAESRDGRIGAHGSERFRSGFGHRGDEDPQLLLGVAEGALAASHGGLRVGDVDPCRQLVETLGAVGDPFLIRMLGGELVLDLGVGDDPL